jgi:hypothetical protein
MTAPAPVEWTADALDDWRRLPLADAADVARAVQRFADFGEGIAIAGDGGVFLLFVGPRVVELLVDGEMVYVLRVRRT